MEVSQIRKDRTLNYVGIRLGCESKPFLKPAGDYKLLIPMIADVLAAGNLDKAARDVLKNKGSSGIDGMRTTALSDYTRTHRATILSVIHEHSYIPSPILGVSIPKGNGKTRLLGIPTVIDRWLQQVLSSYHKRQNLAELKKTLDPVRLKEKPPLLHNICPKCRQGHLITITTFTARGPPKYWIDQLHTPQ